MGTIKFLVWLILALPTMALAEKKLLIFGGNNHDVYLGCLNCSDVVSDSVHNDIGKYGSNISSTSIFNDIGKYGSDISSDSPCNAIGSNPPVIVDEDGGFYGYLTLNEINSNAITDENIIR